MNYMDQVAKMLGVELGEEFFVTGGNFQSWTEGMYTLKESGLYTSEGKCACGIFSDIIIGVHSIRRKPLTPEAGKTYWYPAPSCESFAYDTTYSPGNDNDITRRKRNLMFRTKEEAVEAAKKMLKALEV